MILDRERMIRTRDYLRKFRDIGDREMQETIECFILSGEYDTAHFCETREDYEAICKKYLERFKVSDGVSQI